VTAPQPPDGWQQQGQGMPAGQEPNGFYGTAPAAGLGQVNNMTAADALAWYNRTGIAAYPANATNATVAMLLLPKGYHFDDLGVLGGDQLAAAYQAMVGNPQLRVAIPLGKASGLVALDADDLTEWERFWAEHGGLLTPTAVQMTGRGLHLLYHRQGIGPELLKQARFPGFPSVELKSKGMIIAAPSLHGSGARYQWQPGSGMPQLISTGLLERFQEGRQQERAVVREIVQLVTRGDRPELEAGNAADFADTLSARLGGGCFTGVYQRDDRLVMVPRFGEKGYVPAKGSDKDPRRNSPAQIRVLTEKALQGLTASRAWTYKFVGDGDNVEKVHILPPLAACSAVINADPASWERVPVLSGVVHIPLLRRDGTLLAAEGYDEATRLLYLPPDGLVVKVPERPSPADARAAGGRIGSLFSQFGWTSNGDYLNYLATLLVPPLRLLLPPPWPLWVINAHERGSGKTLLTEVPRILHGGVLYAAPGDDSEETRKLITTILSSTTGSVVGFDNAEKVLRSRHFAALVTDPSGMWHDRRLGTNESPGLPNDRVWILNGNNIALGGDLPRRALWSTIDPGVPEPWLRPAAGFAIPDLAGHASEHRPEILSDILLLGRHWALAGRPPGRTARGDSFATFAAGMSGLMEAAGLAGPGEFWAAATNRAEDGADDEDWANFLAAVHTAWGSMEWTAGQLIERAGGTVTSALPGDLAGRLSHGDERDSVAKSLGWWLRNHQGRWSAGHHRVRQTGGGKQGHPKTWAVEHRP
jgi:hypothetical protein